MEVAAVFFSSKSNDESGLRCQIKNPATGECVAHVTYATKPQLHDAVQIAKQAHFSFSTTTPIKRAKILYRFRELLEANLEELSALITREHGKVLADARGEVMRAIECVEHACSVPLWLQGPYSAKVASQMDCYSMRQSLGVCVGVTPFNFPVMISTWLAIPAIACGNAVIIKPSEKNPSSVLFMAQLLQQAGLPDGVFNVVNGDKDAVEYLIQHDDVKAVACVGSTPVARTIYQTAIAHGKRAQAFGSAKNHAIIMPDASLDETIPALVGAGFGAAGERCMALSVVVCVGDKVADKVVCGLLNAIGDLTIGDGVVENVDMGPLISAEHRGRVSNYIQKGVDEGARLLVDGRVHSAVKANRGFFLGASLFDNVQSSMSIYQEEIFGPVLCVMRVPDYNTALKLVNQHRYGNGVALFTQSGGVARRFASDVNVGMVGINVPIPVPVATHAFGGWKESVFGDLALHGQECVRFYTRSKSVTVTWPQQKIGAADFGMPTNG